MKKQPDHKKEQFVKELNQLIALEIELEKSFDILNPIFGSNVIDGTLFDSAYRLASAAFANLGRVYGDNNDWVSWWVFENRCKQESCTVAGKKRIVRNAGDLYDVIKAHNESEG